MAAAPSATKTTVNPSTKSPVTRSIRTEDAEPASSSATEYPDMRLR